MKGFVTALFIIFAFAGLLAPLSMADSGPTSVTYAQKSNKGPVVFDHEGHSEFVENSCSNGDCHGSGEHTKIVLNKKTAHGKMCRTCHSHTNKLAADTVAPIKCYECHLKSKNTVAPRLCAPGRAAQPCGQCHK